MTEREELIEFCRESAVAFGEELSLEELRGFPDWKLENYAEWYSYLWEK